MRNHSILLLAMVVLWIGSATDAKYSGGTGDPSDPYQIATPEDLNDIGNHLEDFDKHFILVNDVNLSQYTGTQFNIIGTFTGVFDGNDHKIWNFTWDSAWRDCIGLFGYVGPAGQIKNLCLEDVNVYSMGGTGISGLVGQNGGTITNCYSAGSVSGLGWDIGGLVGGNWGTITDCYTSANVSGAARVGGLVGDNDGTISDCYSSASVSGSSRVGGLVGWNHHGTITNCYSSGSVTGTDNVGGLVGRHEVGGVWDSFWDTETSDYNTSAGGTGKTTAEMKTMSTFTDAGWDFVEIWGIGENQTYPYLRFAPAGDLNYDKKVNLADLAILASHWLEEK